MEGRKQDRKSGGRSRKKQRTRKILVVVSSSDDDAYEVVRRRSKRSATADYTQVEIMKKKKKSKRKRDARAVDSESTSDDSDRHMSEMKGRNIEKKKRTKRGRSKQDEQESSSSGTMPAWKNIMTTAPKSATAEIVVPDIIGSLPGTNQTVMPETAGLAEKDYVTEGPRFVNWFDGPSCSLQLGSYFSTRNKCPVDAKGDDVIPHTEKVESTKFCGNLTDQSLRGAATAEIVIPDIIGSLPETNQTVLPETAENDDVTEGPGFVNWLDGPSCSLQLGRYFSPRNKCPVDAKGDGVIPHTEKVESTKFCGDLTDQSLRGADLLKGPTSSPEHVNYFSKANTGPGYVEEANVIPSPSCSLDLGSYFSPKNKILVDAKRDDVLPNTDRGESNNCCGHEQSLTLVLMEKVLMKDENQDLKERLKQLSDENQDLKERVKQLSDGNKDLKESTKQLSHDKEILLKTKTEEIDDLKAEMSRELDELRAKLYEKEKLLIEVQCERDTLEKSLTAQKEINTKQEQDITEVREDLLKRANEVELLSQREIETIFELSNVKENLKRAQSKECDEILALREKCDYLGALSETHRLRFLELKASAHRSEEIFIAEKDKLEAKVAEIELLRQRESERVKEMELEISTLKEINAKQQQELTDVKDDLLKRRNENEMLTQRGNKTVNELEFGISTLEDNLKSSLHLCDKIIADLTNPAHTSTEVLELVEAHEDKYQNKETDKLKAYKREELISEKDCKLRTEEKTRAYSAVEEVQLDNRMDRDVPTHYESNVSDKRMLEIGSSDTLYCRGKSKVIPNTCSPGSVAGTVNNKRTREDTVTPRPVTLDFKEVICLSHEEELSPLGAESSQLNRDCLPVSEAMDQVLSRNLERANGRNCVIWSGEGPFAKVTAGDALKVLRNGSLTKEIIDSWGELLIQQLNKKGKMTSTFIFTSRIWEVVGRNGGSSTIQEVVNSQIRSAVNSDIIILPTFTPGSAGGYWRLLKYSVRSSTWTLFNSMQSRYNDMVLFKPLMEYMEEHMLRALRDLGKNTLLTRQKRKSKFISSGQIKPPQQIAGSLDCGVIVCHMIENILKGQAVSMIRTSENGVYGAPSDAKYRYRMVMSFCFPGGMKGI